MESKQLDDGVLPHPVLDEKLEAVVEAHAHREIALTRALEYHDKNGDYSGLQVTGVPKRSMIGSL